MLTIPIRLQSEGDRQGREREKERGVGRGEGEKEQGVERGREGQEDRRDEPQGTTKGVCTILNTGYGKKATSSPVLQTECIMSLTLVWRSITFPVESMQVCRFSCWSS